VCQGSTPESVRLLDEALEISCEIEDKGGIASAVEAARDLAAVIGDTLRALALRGAGAGVRESIGAPMCGSDRIWESRTLGLDPRRRPSICNAAATAARRHRREG
jgi:hypothetical protein